MSDMKLDGSVAARQKAAETKAGRPGIVCLCGSGRFRDAFDAAEEAETLRGRIVLTIGCNTKDVARSAELVGHKPMLDELHLRKIDLADEVLILNVDGYIGESTARELAYARSRGKAVRFLETQSDKCSRCDGCGEIATDDEGSPWSMWEALPPQAKLAETLGMVKPIACPVCGGTGKAAEAAKETT